MYENMLVELPFASFFLCKLLSLTNTDVDINHLESLDPEMYRCALDSEQNVVTNQHRPWRFKRLTRSCVEESKDLHGRATCVETRAWKHTRAEERSKRCFHACRATACVIQSAGEEAGD